MFSANYISHNSSCSYFALQLINSWTRDDVVEFHRTHYRPDNVLLYVVGDVDVKDVERYIEAKFGGLSAERHGSELTEEQVRAPEMNVLGGHELSRQTSRLYASVRSVSASSAGAVSNDVNKNLLFDTLRVVVEGEGGGVRKGGC